MAARPVPVAGGFHTAGPIVAIAISLLCQNFGAAFAKGLFGAVGAQATAALRIILAAVILLAFFQPWRKSIERSRIGDLLIYGVVLGMMNLLIYSAFARIPIAVAVAIEATGPLLVVLLSSRKIADLLWLALTAIGLALLLPLQFAWALLDPWGVAFAGAAGMCWALYIWYAKRVSTMSSGATVAWGMTIAAVAIAPIGIVQAGSSLFSPHVLMVGLGVAVFSSVLPYLLEMVALRNLTPKVFGILVSAAPATGALAAFVVLGERLQRVHWVAITCIVIACAGSALSRSSGLRQREVSEKTSGPPTTPF